MGEASISCSLPENGVSNSYSLFSEKAVDELLQSPVQGSDDHLVEFSEALRTVAKALRHPVEGKASAQAEAAEWKPCATEHGSDVDYARMGNLVNQPVWCSEANEQFEKCCGRNGLCLHEVLQDGETDFDSKMVRKASFELSRCCKGEQSDQHKHYIVSFERGNIITAERSSKQISLRWKSHPQTVLILTKPNSISVQVLWLREQKKLDIYIEPRVRVELLAGSSYFSFVQTWKDEKEILLLHIKVDLVVTLGGDGTVLWAASMLKGPVPPIVPFSLGSYGFMTPFHILLLYDTEEPILVLNKVTIDCGISSYLTNLECYCDDSFVTSVQGDGLILSTTSGSTAYLLAAGGSMVPGILICPHSLSFWPLILPEHVTLRVQVPFNSRGHAWAGYALVCSMAPWPVPTACLVDSTSDFLCSIHEDLHWNLRKTQSFDGPRDS
ncbi:hypothetical protein CIPAW_13G156400 [Carya illinoinensis]|uniref:Uncharacterized protein n=1 Tax=Carya illinoinensis TaxID=32201 RepID=A0A8T1NKA1_CARIL|nr:hypothetical protein CIPAW_13G156400 [Carya illinoinensis]